jgi:hypothetical protein
MKKGLITVLSILCLLGAIATAQATSYMSSVEATGNFVLTNYLQPDNTPLQLTLTNITANFVDGLTPAGTYVWSANLSKLNLDLGGNGSNDIMLKPLGLDLGIHTIVGPLPTTGSANLGKVTIPFAMLGMDTERTLINLSVTWQQISTSEYYLTFAADNIIDAKNDLKYLELVYFHNDNGRATGSFDFAGTVTATPVPEPSTLILLGIGLVGVAKFSRKKS